MCFVLFGWREKVWLMAVSLNRAVKVVWVWLVVKDWCRQIKSSELIPLADLSKSLAL